MNQPRLAHLIVLSALALSVLGCKAPEPAAPEVATGPPGLIARDELFGNPDKAAVQLSPDGKHISYLAPVDGVLNVWVGPTSDPGAALAVTDDKLRGIRNYFWAHTNEHIVYLQDLGGDENWRAFSVEVASRKKVDLTPWDGVQAQIQGVSHKVPGQILVGVNHRDARLHDLYAIDVRTGDRQLVEQNPGYANWVSDDDFNVRLAMKNTPDGGWQVDRKGIQGWTAWTTIPGDDALTTQPLGFDETGGVVYMLDSRNRNTAGLFAIDLEKGEAKLLHEHARADVDDAVLHPTKNTVQAVSATFARREWKILDESIRGDWEYLTSVADGELEVLSRTSDDALWIVGYEVADEPYGYYLYDRGKKQAKLLFTSRPELQDERLAPMRDVVIRSRDGLDLVSYLTLPLESDPDGNGKPEAPLPAVLFVHGGPWARDNWGYHPYHQWLANRGYAVLSVNYRGSTGLGKSFVNAGNLQWAAKMHDDLMDAVQWAVTEKVADPARVAIMGGSYGGYATLVGLTFTPDTFACGVDIVGPSNLVTLLESVPPYWKPMLDLFTSRVGDPRTEGGRQLLTERSPLTQVDKIKKPLLIGQGANDPRVKQQESDQIVDAMQAKNIPVTYVLFPDEGHGFARPENRTAFNAVAEAFLGECLGGRVEAIGTDLAGSSITVPAGATAIAGLNEALARHAAAPASPADAAPTTPTGG